MSKKLKNATPKEISAAVNKVSTTIALSTTQTATLEGVIKDSASGIPLDKDTFLKELNLSVLQTDAINKAPIKSFTAEKSLFDSILEFLKKLFSNKKTSSTNG